MLVSGNNVAFVNGRFQELDKASVSVLDRGFLFGDGVYEVVPVFLGKPFHLAAHLKRLKRSLADTGIPCPMTDLVWLNCIRDVVEQNGGGDLSIYIQVTRGVSGERDLQISEGLEPTVLVMPMPLHTPSDIVLREGYSAITQNDFRWQHCDIKTTSLLANVMLKKIGDDADADEVLLLRDGFLTEGASSNVFAVYEGKVFTPQLSSGVLPGITRDAIIKLCKKYSLRVIEGNVSEILLKEADEIWVTSSTLGIVPVTSLNGEPVGSGRPGTLWAVFHGYYQEEIGRIPKDYGAAIRQIAMTEIETN